MSDSNAQLFHVLSKKCLLERKVFAVDNIIAKLLDSKVDAEVDKILEQTDKHFGPLFAEHDQYTKAKFVPIVMNTGSTLTTDLQDTRPTILSR